MPTVDDILKTALEQVGTKENPPDSNRCKYNQVYYGKDVSGSAYPWCCTFVWWVFAQYNPCLVKKTASCADLGTWFKNNSKWYSEPQIGDVVFFKFNRTNNWTNHVGIVKSIKDGAIETIEGNTSSGSDSNGGEVQIRVRKSNIVGYGRPAYSEEPAADPDDNYQYGIDVSECQGIIDWDQVKASGISFACMRSTKKNGNVDKMFERNVLQCVSRGIGYSCYKYAYAQTHDDARREADGVINLLNDLKMPIWYDMEDSSLLPLGVDAIEGIALAFIGECKEAGYDVGIYCNKNWYDNYISQYLKDKYRFWIARYGKNDGKLDEKYKPTGRNIIAWQYTSKGRVPGIEGDVDLDVLY